MKFLRGFSFLFLLGFIFISHSLHNAEAHEYPHSINLLMPHSGMAGHRVKGLNCLSWRLAVETNNLQGWRTVPETCEGYVGNYMMGAQYKRDCFAVTAAAYDYVKSLTPQKNDIWVFDIDETSLSNLPYYAKHGFGAQPYNSTAFNEWQAEAKAVAIPAVLSFYQKLVRLGIKVVFLSGAQEELREPKERNMRNIGYHKWHMMILKQASESKLKAVEYKSIHRTELVEKMGYRIIGSMGDQWSDLLGDHVGMRTFKVPDPMYYIG